MAPADGIRDGLRRHAGEGGEGAIPEHEGGIEKSEPIDQIFVQERGRQATSALDLRRSDAPLPQLPESVPEVVRFDDLHPACLQGSPRRGGCAGRRDHADGDLARRGDQPGVGRQT